MTIREMAERIEATVYAEPDQLDIDLQGAFGSDMMSDVLAFAENRDVLLTGLLNPQIVRTAHMQDMRCIIIVRGKTATEEIKRLAAENRIALLETKLTMYEASGKLYEGGLGR